MENRTTDRPRLVLVERPARLPASAYTNAAMASPEWRNARDVGSPGTELEFAL